MFAQINDGAITQMRIKSATKKALNDTKIRGGEQKCNNSNIYINHNVENIKINSCINVIGVLKFKYKML